LCGLCLDCGSPSFQLALCLCSVWLR